MRGRGGRLSNGEDGVRSPSILMFEHIMEDTLLWVNEGSPYAQGNVFVMLDT
jgi:hypothetical protein